MRLAVFHSGQQPLSQGIEGICGWNHRCWTRSLKLPTSGQRPVRGRGCLPSSSGRGNVQLPYGFCRPQSLFLSLPLLRLQTDDVPPVVAGWRGAGESKPPTSGILGSCSFATSASSLVDKLDPRAGLSDENNGLRRASTVRLEEIEAHLRLAKQQTI